jgi:molybdenum cofactor cytidylyltransferase
LNERRTVLAAITAAGASSRMGSPKALLPWGSGTVLSAIVQTLTESEVDPVVVITGAHGRAIAAEASRAGARAVNNDAWEDGRFASIQAAARCTFAHSTRAALLLWPVDCPGVIADTVRALLDGAHRDERANVVPRCGDRRGHPVLLCADMVATVLSAPTDSNLRDLLRRSRSPLIDVEVEDAAIAGNLNLPADYEDALRGQKKEAVE